MCVRVHIYVCVHVDTALLCSPTSPTVGWHPIVAERTLLRFGRTVSQCHWSHRHGKRDITATTKSPTAIPLAPHLQRDIHEIPIAMTPCAESVQHLCPTTAPLPWKSLLCNTDTFAPLCGSLYAALCIQKLSRYSNVHSLDVMFPAPPPNRPDLAAVLRCLCAGTSPFAARDRNASCHLYRGVCCRFSLSFSCGPRKNRPVRPCSRRPPQVTQR